MPTSDEPTHPPIDGQTLARAVESGVPAISGLVKRDDHYRTEILVPIIHALNSFLATV